MHKPLSVFTAGSIAAVGGLIIATALPAAASTAGRDATPTTCAASCSEDTPVTFTVGATGTLDITVPTPTLPISLGGVTGTGGGVTGGGALGLITVVDTRNSSPSNWTVSVNDSIFTNTTSADTIAANAATYTSGGVAASGPGAVITDLAVSGLQLGTSPTEAVGEAGADGANGATWTPTVTVTVPSGAVAGTYTGTVTHSIA